MNMLPTDEYLEIKEFLRHRVCEINHSDNYDRENQRERNTKYSLPNATAFGWMPAITICYSFDIGNKQIVYMIPFLAFYRYLTEFLPQALYNCPDIFGTKDAKDVITALYSVSEYDKIGDINEYQQYLIAIFCCEIVTINSVTSFFVWTYSDIFFLMIRMVTTLTEGLCMLSVIVHGIT